MIAESGAGNGRSACEFFYREYQLNHLLFTYVKPVVAFMDGITMGGGVGISQPNRYRIATENTVFAMPETAIGLFPDVGGGWYLSRLPGRTGRYLALTGARLDGAECRTLGLATHYLPTAALDEAKAKIAADPQSIATILNAAAVPVPAAPIMARRDVIDRLFASDRIEDVFRALEADGGEWAAKERSLLEAKSPQSCKVALRLLRESAGIKEFADEMRMEYRVVTRICRSTDFAEGVRALLVDRDNAPRWNPSTPAVMTDQLVDAFFAPLPKGEEWIPI